MECILNIIRVNIVCVRAIATNILWWIFCGVRVRVFNATFNNISVIYRGGHVINGGKQTTQRNHQPAASHWQTITKCCIEYTSRWGGFKLSLVVIGTDCTGSCRSNHYAITNQDGTPNILCVGAIAAFMNGVNKLNYVWYK